MAFPNLAIFEKPAKLFPNATAIMSTTLIGVIVLLGITIWAWKITSISIHDRNLATFDALTADSEHAMRSRLQSYRQSLDGGAALFGASKEVSRDKWKAYVTELNIEETLPGINGIGLIKAVQKEKIQDYLSSTRSQGIKELQIHPTTEHPEILPITYIEPIEPNREALGLDIGFETNRRNAAHHARSTGKATITKRIDLVQDETKSAGFLLLRPTYEPGSELETVEQRRAAFRGWIYAPFIATRFMAGLTTSQGKSLDIEVYDGMEPSQAKLIYSSYKISTAEQKPLYAITRTFPMMEQNWTIVWKSTPEFEASVGNQESFMILVGGAGLTIVFLILMFFYGRREAYVKNEVAIKTQELVLKEKQLSSALSEAETATEAKSKFLANMSHEIRTPMNGVIGFTQLLDDGSLDEKQKKYVQMISESGSVMMSLLNDVLDISKVDAGLMTINSDPIDVRHLLQNCIRLISPSAEAKKLELVSKIDPELPSLLKGDDLRLRQVISNLLANAVKFTDTGGIVLSASYQPDEGSSALTAKNGRLLISISDTGIGIAPDRQQAIFEPFKQEDDSTARKFGGTGLGLSISNQLIGLMGGTVTLDSQLGHGSTFAITIPVESCENTEPACPAGQHGNPVISIKSEEPARSKAKILVAEDHDVNQILATEMLTQLGYEIELANDGAEAVAKVKQAIQAGQPFDLVLMDIQMPNIDGLRATAIIRNEGISAEKLPIIALTANAYAEDIKQCLDVGMQEHLAKPFSARKLQNVLTNWMKNHPATVNA